VAILRAEPGGGDLPGANSQVLGRMWGRTRKREQKGMGEPGVLRRPLWAATASENKDGR